MATAKRVHENEENDDKIKKMKVQEEDIKLKEFLEWCSNGKLNLSDKVKIGREGSCAEYGMVAQADITKGDVLFEIPRSLILTQDNCSIADLLKQESEEIKSESGWVPLLIALLHEHCNPNSKWKAYLDCFFRSSQLDLPMFWCQDELNTELCSTGVIEAVNRDLKGITQEFKKIVVPFITKHSKHFPSKCNDLDLYKKFVAFIMAYSFTEPIGQEDDDEDEFDYEIKSPPMMVPMADVLNHVAKNNAQLKFGKESLKMVACKEILQGEEVFNTYGELANWQLLHMYGFSEPHDNNHFDTVELPSQIIYRALSKGKEGAEEKLVKEKWNFLKSVDMVTDDAAFVVGKEGILTEEETIHTLKVMIMTAQEFDAHLENGGWMEDDGEADSLSFESIPNLSKEIKDMLLLIAEECLSNYKSKLEEEEKKISSEDFTHLKNRQKFSVHVRHGQLQLLHCLRDACTKETPHKSDNNSEKAATGES